MPSAQEMDTPIIPIHVGNEARTMALGAALAARGYLVGAVRPPTVPPGGSRLRVTMSAAHTSEQIAGLVSALANLFADPSTATLVGSVADASQVGAQHA